MYKVREVSFVMFMGKISVAKQFRLESVVGFSNMKNILVQFLSSIYGIFNFFLIGIFHIVHSTVKENGCFIRFQ